MARFTQDFINKVIDNSDIYTIVSRYTRLTKKGGRYFGLCPFPDHNEKTASFSVVPDKGFYYCFGCEKGGNVVSFIMEINRMSFPEAIEYLANEANMEPEYEDGFNFKEAGSYTQKKVLYEINKKAANYFYKNLMKSDYAIKYLTDRGISREAMKTFGLGLSPRDGGLYRYLTKEGFSKKDILAANLIKENEKGVYEYFRDRIMFPIQDVSDNIVGFGGRIIGKGEPKYLNSPENAVFYKGSMLYNLNKAKASLQTNPVIMVEGYMDVISLYDKGIKSVCASLGTALGEKHAKLIKRYTNNVVLCYDGDNAGVNAAIRGSGILENEGLSVKVLVLSDDHDPDSYIRAYGAKEFVNRVAEAKYATDFKIEQIRKRYDLSDIQDRSRFAYEACGIVAQVNDEIKWDHYAKKIASMVDIDILTIKGMITEQYEEQKSNKEENKPTEIKEQNFFAPSKKELTQRDKTELAVLKYISESYDKYKNYIECGGGNYFSSQYALLYEEIEKLYSENNFVDINKKLLYNNMLAETAALLNSLQNEIKDSEIPYYTKSLLINVYSDRLKSIKRQIDDENTKLSEKAQLLAEHAYIKEKLMEIKNEVGY